MIRIGAVDLGTNSIRVLIADAGMDEVNPVFKKAVTTRLGHRVYETGVIGKESIDNTVQAIMVYKQIMEEYGVKQSFGMATSAVRSAQNGKDVIRYIEERTGIKISILSGEEEAYLGYLGVRTVIKSDKPILVVDIGGGSTEFVLGSGRDIFYRESLPLGCVRITESFFGENTCKAVDDKIVDNMRQYINDSLNKTAKNILDISDDFKIIAIGGTATTLSAIKFGIEGMEGGKLYNRDLTEFIDKLIVRDEELVEKINCIERGRDDIILAGVLELQSIMRLLGRDFLIASERDSLEGAVYYKINNF
ncbi:hypothetical protein [Fonticella tunisiensis]|uniref:Exopolyphosphatase/guanosine-5'-triphosphate, 3'-diphosphate pyrophosphatase n=1 Tax=Fonticella tunisiensis TaxID=1096341 RepID=A0A4R7KTW0_9CLOT|nr:hypothetical protein [Fonticella tunisiensis]TDT63473.1 exopolyphosphatase/guanosine-5'-triphosphate,3'-diphosphate pyrophosphatase [Fonticella tunisiensis]